MIWVDYKLVCFCDGHPVCDLSTVLIGEPHPQKRLRSLLIKTKFDYYFRTDTLWKSTHISLPSLFFVQFLDR